MSGGGAAPERARPLSAGLWSLLGWLRRGDSASTDSLSSGGSTGSGRTTASFAFLSPHRYALAAGPAPLPPPPPPTDSYRKRVRDRNIRRQCERDITLHRKYRLPLGEGSPGFDAFSLPAVRRSLSLAEARQERERRAASESLQRRAAYVPGKRRAPPPPAPQHPAPAEPRRRAAKRPAPQPPHLRPDAQHNTLPRIKEKDYSALMASKPLAGERNTHDNDKAAGCKAEKYSRKNSQTQPKPRQERSFLKHIFDSRKRNSAMEPATVKLLPSISELDRQAAELMETYKLKAYQRGDDNDCGDTKNDKNSNFKGDAWFCTRCLKKYDSTMVTCLDCLSEAKVSSGSAKYKDQLPLKNIYTRIELNPAAQTPSSSKDDERQKLKQMLKEIKDSLPKRPQPQKSDNEKIVMTFKEHPDEKDNISKETPTLPMGSSIQRDISPLPSSSKQSAIVASTDQTKVDTSLPSPSSGATETVLVTQTIVLTDPGLIVTNNKTPPRKAFENPQSGKLENLVSDIAPLTQISNRNEPLKISSLLNPIYIPKCPSNIAINHSNNYAAKKSFLAGSEPVGDFGAGTSAAQVTKEPPTVRPTDRRISAQIAQGARESPPSSPKIRISTQPQVTNIKITSHLHTTANTSAATTNQVNDILKTNEPNRRSSDPKGSPIFTTKSVIETKNPKAVVEPKSEMAKPRASFVPENKGPRFTPELLCKRRELISQLEKSIASGDEKAAAEAAIRLAQLKLSCSVLSFSSQIIADSPSTSAAVQKPNTLTDATTATNAPVIKSVSSKVNSSTQSIGTKCIKVMPSSSMQSKDNATEKCNISTPKETSPPTVTSVPTKGPNTSNVTVSTKPSTSQGLQKSGKDKSHTAPIEVWVEDREAVRGPIRLSVSRQSTLGQLRREAETSLGIPARLQRWIVGRALCNDDSAALASLAGPAFDAPFYLCLVESETKAALADGDGSTEPHEEAGAVYSELVQLELRALLPNAEAFECGVCMEECAAGAGVVLRDCVHAFCRECLAAAVGHCEEPAVRCPARGCAGTLQEREVRSLVPPAEYERWLARGLAAAESGARHAFHCRTRDCAGWALAEPGVRRFPCPVCRRTNCVPCQAIHEGESCEQHRARLREAAASTASTGAGAGGETDAGTRALLDSLIARGEALECPECSAVITKKWGCDWVRCSACKTEICWVTRGARWGPAGRGDTSAGCRCGVGGKRCHPSCAYCH